MSGRLIVCSAARYAEQLIGKAIALMVKYWQQCGGILRMPERDSSRRLQASAVLIWQHYVGRWLQDMALVACANHAILLEVSGIMLLKQRRLKPPILSTVFWRFRDKLKT